MLEVCLDVDPNPDQVAVVRGWVQKTLTEWELAEHAGPALLVASELATNAVLHARTPYRVTLRTIEGNGVRVEVYDDNPRPPVRAADDEGATSGRGLQVIVALATSWGSSSDGTGKTVWAELGGDVLDDDTECVDLRGVDSAEDALDRIDRHRDRDRDQPSH